MEDRYLSKAKRISDGEWVVGYIVRYGHTRKEKYYIIPNYASDLYSFLIDENTICQCTGLKDKNGRLIWENDIVDIPHGMPVYNTGCGKIRLSCATGIDIYCNACGKKIKIVDDTKVGENNEQ